ncbi:E3 ubiquitin-protein ligase LRSAM1-like isoform X1 [Diorhabda sublineata]|uniref:E3 ubiquitin-protein ligase LRSAM1-like isoform X1 n=1 Tax=Diorhabda sublineata TaxID=1163346 RepID=UPI0024E0A4B4|nr:E3 ubiquitin-protein ligase LRSAM1-like isoform X1 [Diorhabda sublineata]
MFKKRHPNKAKLEHKLYLARENPELIFDISDCDIREVPSGIYSLCRVFLKESLNLEHNMLSSLSGGGSLKDLHLLKVLNLNHNVFTNLPDEIGLLSNLQELSISNNHLKKLCDGFCALKMLRVLDVSHNQLKALPKDLGNLTKLRRCNLSYNKIKYLPTSIHKWKNIQCIELDADEYIYPPANITSEGTYTILQYICDDVGVPFCPNEDEVDADKKELFQIGNQNDSLQEKIWELENIKQQKMREYLEIERLNELMMRQELEYANTSKLNRDKLLEVIAKQQNVFDNELSKIHQEKEIERFRLLEQLQEVEHNADIAIKELLALSNEPLGQLLEQEKLEEEKLLSAINRYNETLRKDDILAAMQDILAQETVMFQELHQNRLESSKSILEQETKIDNKLLEVLQNQDDHKAELICKLIIDNDLQKAAVGTLLERGDARSWGLLQQIRLVEAQLAALTKIEIDRKKLQIDEHMIDLCEKRCNLSVLLIDLLEQQKERRSQLISTLQTMEENNKESVEDFWLRQYQRLLDKLPEGLSHAQKNIDPLLAQALLLNGVIHCLPFLAKLTQSNCDTRYITDNDLLKAGVLCGNERRQILDAFNMYEKEKKCFSSCEEICASAPPQSIEEASAPLPDNIKAISASECVICLDVECQIIFVPCGHLCCCCNCSVPVSECPLCRETIERKITLIL